MFLTLRNRFIIIAVLVLASVWSLVPRKQTQRERGTDGIMRDTTIVRIPLKRGLDLAGGMHLALELDQSKQVSADPKRDIDLALTVLRKRIDEFGVVEPVVQKVGDGRIIVELPGMDEPARAVAIVQRTAFLEFRITDETGALDKAIPSMDRVLRSAGVKAAQGEAPSAVQQLLGGDSAKVPADSTADTTAITGGVLASLIRPSNTGVPGEYLVPENSFPRVDSLLNIPEVRRLLGRGVDFRWSAAKESIGAEFWRALYVVESEPIVTGEHLIDARAEIDPLTNAPVVRFRLNSAGGRRFGEGTGRHVGDFMAIVLDGRVQGQPPVIQSRIDREGQITLAGRTIQEAQDLALTLKAGALPIPLKIVEKHEIGASLGDDSIRDGMVAGIAGTVLVVLIMVGYYHLAGVFAIAALALYILFTLGALAMLGATLTLPGIAGIVLSIGAAVDANVLIFERIKEELAKGRTVVLAAQEGFARAMNAVVDSNVCVILTALFLYQFGTGPVKGFAVTLIIGTLASMITAVFVTRTLFLWWIARHPATSTLSI